MTRARILSVGYNWLTGAVKGCLRPNDWNTWAKTKIFKSLVQISNTYTAGVLFCEVGVGGGGVLLGRELHEDYKRLD